MMLQRNETLMIQKWFIIHVYIHIYVLDNTCSYILIMISKLIIKFSTLANSFFFSSLSNSYEYTHRNVHYN